MRSKSKLVMALLAVLILSIGCDQGGGGGGGGGDDPPPYCCDISCNQYAPTIVVHGIDPEGTLYWENASDVFYYESAGDRCYTIYWYCADYNSHNNVYVQLDYWDWADDGQGWLFDSEFISDGICDDACL